MCVFHPPIENNAIYIHESLILRDFYLTLDLMETPVNESVERVAMKKGLWCVVSEGLLCLLSTDKESVFIPWSAWSLLFLNVRVTNSTSLKLLQFENRKPSFCPSSKLAREHNQSVYD